MDDLRPSHGTVRFGAFEVDLDARELRKQGGKLKLQEQPFEILQILLQKPGQIVTREELRQKIWHSDTFVDFDHGLYNAIKRLREALGDAAETPQYVETLSRRGYRFIGKIECESSRIGSIAVLPLENLSRDPDQEYFADGLTEALITNLAKISALRVISRTTSMHYKNARRPVSEVAQELSVDKIVEGTVLRSGDRVRISAQLIDGSTDTHLWAESYDRDLRDVLALHSELAQAIAHEIQIKLTPQEEAQLLGVRAVDPRAYDAYLKGRFFWNKRNIEGLSKGAEYFQQAIEIDPSYAAAYAGLADSAGALGWWNFVPPEHGCGRGKAAALKALALDSTLADGHASLGFCLLHYNFDFLGAERALQRALELNPRSPTAVQWHAGSLTAQARMVEAVAEAERAVQLDPLSLIINWTLTGLLYHARKYEQAIAQSQRALELHPQVPHLQWTIAVAFVKQEKYEAAIAAAEESVRLAGNSPVFLASLGPCYGSAGYRDKALEVLRKLQELSKERFVSPYWRAVVFTSLCEKDQAFACLDAAYRERSPWMAYNQVFPWFDNLRTDVRFQDLLRRMNSPA